MFCHNLDANYIQVIECVFDIILITQRSVRYKIVITVFIFFFLFIILVTFPTKPIKYNFI